ncbi:Hypothetical predicted protein [Lecanosticta acicola]|uniref:TATA element modulatory factor 1 TATA binding domain-containing protein n=1 Tax=Lecanosticta acicola TaxID=111012 RepID=A0AAI8Z5E5_9PEZI|nr:Hypothetical predicted protein [Lecanosticta acicola]
MSAQKKGGWGFSNLVANLESRLDTILADDSEASAKERAALEAAKANRQRSNSGRLATPSNTSDAGSRETSRTRVNDRLAERLARATAQKTPSRVSTPVDDAIRSSGESQRSGELPRTVPDIEIQKHATEEVAERVDKDAEANGEDADKPSSSEPGSLTTSALPINPARISIDSSRPSADVIREESSGRPSIETPNGTNQTTRSSTELQAETDQMQSDHAKAEIQRQDEMHAYLERIDALQAKLTYLARETVAAAKEANASAAAGSPEEQLAKRDEKIALLMEEGEKLSKNEMHHLQTIKKLRAKATEDERSTADLKKKLERAERSEADLKIKLRKAEVAERQANEKTKQIAVIEKQVDELKVDRKNAAELVRSLTTQLKEAKEKAEKADREASAADMGKIADLQNELEDAQIEKKLAEDRAAAEAKRAKDEAQRQLERFAVRELESKNEISGLESRLEAMRARAEEASSGPGGEGESSVKLMRQVETLQQQYALAKGNWETIEGSLNARVAALEKERDEISKRESDIRKKARDVGTKSRKAEEELESSTDKIKQLEQDLRSQQEQLQLLRANLDQASASQSDAKAEFENQRKLWDAEFAQRLEEEKIKWRRETLGSSANRTGSPRTESNATFARKASATDMSHRNKPLTRLGSYDLATLHIDPRSVSRRSSVMPTPTSSRALATPTEASLSISRRESTFSFDAPNHPLTPAIEVDTTRPSEAGDFEDFNSPQRTIADLVSTSTAGPGAGPSVQLVERMSSLVRKLESEKASFKDELVRLSAQRDDARNQVVELMREMESKRQSESKTEELEKEIAELKGRYEASLEMLGEREEEVEELRSDVGELKRIYRELVETKVGGGDVRRVGTGDERS